MTIETAEKASILSTQIKGLEELLYHLEKSTIIEIGGRKLTEAPLTNKDDWYAFPIGVFFINAKKELMNGVRFELARLTLELNSL
jgi:hypothetical protein